MLPKMVTSSVFAEPISVPLAWDFMLSNMVTSECLKYAHENGCPWDEDTCFRIPGVFEIRARGICASSSTRRNHMSKERKKERKKERFLMKNYIYFSTVFFSFSSFSSSSVTFAVILG